MQNQNQGNFENHAVEEALHKVGIDQPGDLLTDATSNVKRMSGYAKWSLIGAAAGLVGFGLLKLRRRVSAKGNRSPTKSKHAPAKHASKSNSHVN